MNADVTQMNADKSVDGQALARNARVMHEKPIRLFRVHLRFQILARITPYSLRLSSSVAATRRERMPGSKAEWPASGTIV
jgi:hypothetical protein